MKRKPFRRVFCALLCLMMVLSLTGTALAFETSDEEQNISIRITPPTSLTGQRAEVEIRITDNAGAGFQSAQVKVGGGGWRDVTGELEQTENRWYTVVEVTENCSVSVCVTGLDGITYEKSAYIQCFDPSADHRGTSPGQPDTETPSGATPQPSHGATPPGGQGTVIDNVSGTSEESSREFFTIATPDENVFYLVIDRERDSENVYFLNAVTESDLMALAEKDGEQEGVSAVPDPEPVCNCTDKCVLGAINTDCPVCAVSMKDCTGKAPATEPDTEPEPEKSNSGAMILVVVAALAVGGAGYYLKIWKPKHDLDDAEDFDALTGEGEETVNEDDLPPAPRHDPSDEPEEPDYPEGYGYEEPEDNE